MHTPEPWVIWVILAAILVIAEIFTAGFFIMFFGLGALPAAAAAYFGAPIFWQLMIFIISSSLLLAFARKFALKVTAGAPANIGANRMTGSSGIVLEEINPTTATGLVRIDREEWRAESEGGAVIEPGEWVEVIRVEGTRVVVRSKKQTTEENQT
ncbi:MAG TPA: NfeD family protein [bacterium]|nr:NfeD family protein [bacterium]